MRYVNCNLLTFLLVIFVQSTNGTPCIGDGVFVDGVCYKESSSAVSFDVGEAWCKNNSGNLAIISNGFTNAAVKSAFPTGNFWIGAKWDGSKLTWVDGSTSQYAKWKNSAAPTNSGCVFVDAAGYWEVDDCSASRQAACSAEPMKDCADWKKNSVGGQLKSNIYAISVNGEAVNVYCNMDVNGGGWTVLQNRVDATERFWNRTWAEYKAGFGQMSEDKSFFLSLDAVSAITYKKSPMDMRIELWGDRVPGSNMSDAYWWNEYVDFSVSDETTNYTLSISLDWSDIPGNASGAWYDITYSSGRPFSTVDRIHDPDADCVNKFHLGGWWLYNCAFSSLNGEYVPPIGYGGGYGMFWIVQDPRWKKGEEYQFIINPKKSRMMFRPHNFQP